MLYFDNASTAMIHPNIINNAREILSKFGNPSSKHKLGIEIKELVEQTRELVANSIKANRDEIYFFSSATEINNAVLKHLFSSKKIKKVLCSKTVHSSIKKVVEEAKGIDVIYLYKNGYNNYTQQDYKKYGDVDLIIVEHTNNETGLVHEIPNIGIPVFLDCAQSYLKIEIDVRKSDVIALSISGHKIGALKGIAVLYMKKSIKISPVLLGGGQERGIRSSTENVPGILSIREVLLDVKEITFQKELMIDKLKDNKNLKLYYSPNSSPHIILVNTKDIPAEVFANALSSKGVYISTGSACHSNKKTKNNEVYRLIDENSDNFVRISFSPFNTEEEILEASKIIGDTADELAEFIGGINK